MTLIWKTSLTLEELNNRCRDTLISHLGITFTEIGPNFLIAEMPIQTFHLQPMGLLHGGASAMLAETVASAAANCAIDLNTHSCVGLDLNINHLKPVQRGNLQAKTFPYHIGRSTQVWAIEITDEDGKLIAISRLTVANLEKKSSSIL